MPSTKTLLQTPSLTNQGSLKTLVENRTVFSLEQCELNLFETYEKSQLVPLQFNDLVVTSMLRGKKVMHLYDDPAFDYLPGETVIIPSKTEMKIDFPEARQDNPTQCLALAIDHEKIARTLDYLNERYPREQGSLWKLNHHDYFFYNNVDLAATLNKLVRECMSDAITKDALADLTLQELLVRIIQTQALKQVEDDAHDSQLPMAQVVVFIRKNLTSGISLKTLSEKACMSTTSFYRYFKREIGMSPLEFVLSEKIRHAKQLLRDHSLQINEICYMSGFEDSNYFTRIFKKYEGITPKQYRMLLN